MKNPSGLSTICLVLSIAMGFICGVLGKLVLMFIWFACAFFIFAVYAIKEYLNLRELEKFLDEEEKRLLKLTAADKERLETKFKE